MARKPAPLRPQLPLHGGGTPGPPRAGAESASDGRPPAASERRTDPSAPKPAAPRPVLQNVDEASVDIDDVLDGKYRLLQRLDEGGMGSVFVAHNEALDVPVAVKVIRSDVKGESKAKLAERLLQEARAAARLGHPGIVRMLDFGTAPSGDPYLVMELLDGEDLATALDQRGRVNPAKAVRLLLPVMHALAAAHDKGIVHRDLKPDNIILAQTEGGQIQPKLIDFGIAKLARPEKRRLTMVGDALGTPEYMSPQQARGEDVDAKADIWAMCVLLYEMVTGALPFDGHNYHALLRAIIEDEPVPISNLGVQADALWQIIRKGLAKELDERWSSMRELGAALAGWLMAQGITEDLCGTSLRAAWLQAPSLDVVDVLASLPPPSPVAATAPPSPVGAGKLEVKGVPARALEASLDQAGADRAVGAAGEPRTTARSATDRASPGLDEPPGVVAAASSESPVGQPGEADDDSRSVDVAVETEHAPSAPARTGRSWIAYPLWLAAITGVAWAVTGYLGVDLPGLPARLPTPSWLGNALGSAGEPRGDTARAVSGPSTPSGSVPAPERSSAAIDEAGDAARDEQAGEDGGEPVLDAAAADGGAPAASAQAAAGRSAATGSQPPAPPTGPPARRRDDRYLPSQL